MCWTTLQVTELYTFYSPRLFKFINNSYKHSILESAATGRVSETHTNKNIRRIMGKEASKISLVNTTPPLERLLQSETQADIGHQ
jgi:hypothetical protein